MGLGVLDVGAQAPQAASELHREAAEDLVETVVPAIPVPGEERATAARAELG